MPFPLPVCPNFRKAVIAQWLDDVEDRLDLQDPEGAEQSWKTASTLYLSLPAGCGDFSLEDRLWLLRVRLDSLTDAINENAEQQRPFNHHQGQRL